MRIPKRAGTMSTKRMTMIVVFGVLFVVVVVLISQIAGIPTRRMEDIPLPTPSAGQGEDPLGSGGSPAPAVDQVVVTPENVQRVIGTIVRPERYSRELTIETFHDGGVYVVSILTAKKDDATAIRETSGATVRHIIVTEDMGYIWYDGSQRIFERALPGDGGDGDLADQYARILTYEDVLALPKASIADAGYTRVGEEDCIYVDYTAGAYGNRSIFYVSITSGLLVSAERYEPEDDGGQLFYRMTSGRYSEEAPEEALFTLPDRRVISG